MRYGSVSSGIECAALAWEPLGWSPAFLAEIDPFASTVLHHHHSSGRPRHMPSPDVDGLDEKERRKRRAAIKAVASLPDQANGVPNHGDMTTFEEWPDADIDLLIGGTPCQSYSIAGLRKGLDDPRGDLTLTYAAIARKFRPRWLVWENVAGVLSHDRGRSFASLLGLLSGRRVEVPRGGWQSAGIVEGYHRAYGLAWRVLDTQYVRVDGFGRAIPQRRRRVFVVGYFGDWRRAAAVLLEREGMSGGSPPRRGTQEYPAGTLAGGARSRGGYSHDDIPLAVAPTLDASYGRLQGQSGQDANHGHGHLIPTEVAGTLCRDSFSGGAGGRPEGAASGHFVPIAFNSREDPDVSWDISAPLGASTPQAQAIAWSIMPQNSGKDYKARMVEVTQPLMAGGPVGGNQGGDYIQTKFGVRRLTPRECCRLQGVPDDYFDEVVWRKKSPPPDGPIYKTLGNGFSINVVRWIGRRIEFVEQLIQDDRSAA